MGAAAARCPSSIERHWTQTFVNSHSHIELTTSMASPSIYLLVVVSFGNTLHKGAYERSIIEQMVPTGSCSRVKCNAEDMQLLRPEKIYIDTRLFGRAVRRRARDISQPAQITERGQVLSD